ncbi:hypothetical protein [Methylorubrum extorquens]|uniref:hypothetical protein n=1 Tax=Methylorubrum extorquens TaxID=408 RepID=UPI001300D027
MIYHNAGGGPDGPTTFRRLLGNLANDVEALSKKQVEIRVVSHRRRVSVFQSALNDSLPFAQATSRSLAEDVKRGFCSR